MKKVFSAIIISIIMSLSLSTVSFAYGQSDVDKFFKANKSSLSQFEKTITKNLKVLGITLPAKAVVTPSVKSLKYVDEQGHYIHCIANIRVKIQYVVKVGFIRITKTNYKNVKRHVDINLATRKITEG